MHATGGPKNVWSFLDRTLKPIARPGNMQRAYYNGHKKRHGIYYQGIATPDGLISSLQGPFIGKTGDWRMWIRSGVQDKLKDLLAPLPVRNRPLIYGDAAYKMGGFSLIGAFTAGPNQEISPEKRQFNKVMSSFRVAIEHSFGGVSNLWQSLDFTRGLSIGKSPVAAIYIVAVLLANCKNCLRPNQTAQFFDMKPP